MIKVSEPGSAGREAVALRAFPAAASVTLHDHDVDAGQLLLERLGPDHLDVLGPGRGATEQMIVVQAELARRLAVPDPGGLPAVRESGGWLAQLEDQRRRRPRLLPQAVLDAARATIAGLAADPSTTVTHGDLHARNVLRDGSGRWRAIDPNPTVGPVAHEGHTVVRDRLSEVVGLGPVELVRRLALFAEVSGADRDLCVRLCQARAVSSAYAEHLRGAVALADELAWMATVLTPAGTGPRR